jgi:hypothetical protein
MEIISTLFVKKEVGIIKFEAIDYVYTCAFNKINMFDFMPHLYYSPVNYNTDIQGNYLRNVIQF